jgi:hypothetical protein
LHDETLAPLLVHEFHFSVFDDVDALRAIALLKECCAGGVAVALGKMAEGLEVVLWERVEVLARHRLAEPEREAGTTWGWAVFHV